MIRHIVAWNLVADDAAQRDADAAAVKERLEALVGVIPGLQRLVVLRDLGETAGNRDLLLDSDYDDRDALAAYQVHPAHQEVVAFVKTVTTDRACVDWEI